MMALRWFRALALVAATACSAGPLPPVRFANAPVALAVDDRRDVPSPPARREFLPVLYNYDGAIQRRFTRALELPRPQRALGVNALDEVPDSTWFTNRIGVRELSPDEVRAGPVTDDSPELHRPWIVRSTKVGGASVGFVVTDARGIKYLLKFDDADNPDIETGTDVVVNRLMWAAGYNVAEDQIVYFRDEDLVLARDSSVKDAQGNKVGPLDRAGLEQRLALIDHGRDGRIRGLLSRWIPGTTLGGHPSEGVRDDDPNDAIPHQLRRDLRGAYAIFAWVDHVDLHEGNFVDSWTADPVDPHRHYVRHYFVDFGRSLGAMAWFEHDWRRGHTYVVDFRDIGRELFSFGLVDSRWRHRPLSPQPGVASFDATTFDPGDWHPDWPSYLPVLAADAYDKFWGAKLVARFTRAQIAAAVDAARFHDPAVARYLVDTLVARQRATAAHWFSRVNPLDRFAVSQAGEGAVLCFDDLAIAGGHAEAGTTRYALASHDWQARPVAPAVELAAGGGHTCAPLVLATPEDHAGYTIVRITTARPEFRGETQLHVARDPVSRAPRVIGVWRP
jgi:hypothetical protein